jgi:hypothetical protein
MEGTCALCELKKDPGEAKNIAAERQDVVGERAADWEKTVASEKVRGLNDNRWVSEADRRRRIP